MNARNHYEALRVPHDATPGEVALAFREAMNLAYRQQPPDAARLASLREAQRVLSDAELRREYDAALPQDTPRIVRRRVEDDAPQQAAGVARPVKLAIGVAAIALIGLWWARPGKTPVVAMPAEARVASPAPEPILATTSGPAPPLADENRPRTARELFATVGRSVGRVLVYRGTQHVSSGSAVVIADATIITNCHVLAPGDSAQLDIGNRRYGMRLLVADQEFDLCKMSVPGLAIPPVRLSSERNVSNNLQVFAIGAPGGGPVVISEGTVTTLVAIRPGNVIQTTAHIAPGSSGGGLFSADGRLIGITTFQERSLEARNYAIPVDWLDSMSTREGNGQADAVVPPVYWSGG